MAGSLSIASDVDRIRVFPCPNCKETIDTSAQQCRFCGALIDTTAAQAAAEATSRVSRACSDASYLKIAAITMLVFLGLMFVPFIGLLGLCGYWFLSIAVPVLAIRWWVRFARVRTEDPDFSRARRIVIVITVLFVLPLGYDLFSLISR